jgi:hypothetical protein
MNDLPLSVQSEMVGILHRKGIYKRAPRHGGEAVINFVFCSKTMPAMILGEDHGKWTAVRLAPGNDCWSHREYPCNVLGCLLA